MTTERGQRLLTIACERTPRMDAGQPRSDCEDHVTFLDDEAGHGIESDERLTVLLKDIGDDLWVLPALALHRIESDDSLLQRFRMWWRRRKVSKAYGMIAHTPNSTSGSGSCR